MGDRDHEAGPSPRGQSVVELRRELVSFLADASMRTQRVRDLAERRELGAASMVPELAELAERLQALHAVSLVACGWCAHCGADLSDPGDSPSHTRHCRRCRLGWPLHAVDDRVRTEARPWPPSPRTA